LSDLKLTPAGHLLFVEDAGDVTATLQEALAGPIRRAFEKCSSEGLLILATLRHESALPPAFAYWRRFAERYLTALCHVPEPAEDLKQPLPPPRDDLAELAAAAPPMRGGEYLRPDTLDRIWSELDAYARADIAAGPGGLSDWLKRRSPLWHRVGRVCFHLAENPRDAEYPFAFLAAYAPRLSDGGRVLYQPLGRALEEYAGAKNKAALVRLLTPVQRAAERCAWVKALVEAGDVFHPLRWAPGEAYRLLRDVPALEESGLLVRVPDWWSKRPPRVRASVSIGETRQTQFGAETLLSFQAGLTLDGERVTEEEWRRILAETDGLVRIKGKWVEVDREQLARALEHWKRVEEAVGRDGVSFIEGMRLLAGAPIEGGLEGPASAETAAWSDVHAGAWLDARLRELRRPPPAPAADLGLRAALRPYQETGFAWLQFLSRLGLGACLADDMGLGKTIQVLALLLDRKRGGGAGVPAGDASPTSPDASRRTHRNAIDRGRSAGIDPRSAPSGPEGASHAKDEAGSGAPRPALLVMPASLLANWKAEMDRFAPSLVARFAHPSQTQPEDLQAAARDPRDFVQGADAVLTTYGMAARLDWLAGLDWGIVVLDEAQAIKNPSAKQTRAVKRLKAGARVVLTGTPVENRLRDLWSIFDFLCPGLLGSAKAFKEFVKRLEDRGTDPYAPLRRLVGPYILRRLKTDKSVIADLPDKIEQRAFCGLTPKQAALYQQSVRELAEALEEAEEGIARRGVVLAFILRFKQICNHPAQWLGTGPYDPGESGKFRRLRELAEEIAERQEKALVFTQFREITDPLAAFLRTVFGRPGLVLHGGTAVKDRQRLVDDFQREDGPPFFVLSLKAGGSGLNLTAASHVIHFDRWWNPAVENQATDRAFRIGQKKNVLVHKFVCQGTIEDRIDALLKDKTRLAGEILEDAGVPKLITEMGDKELLELVRLDVNTLSEE
jgi:hypothetical protein